MSKDEFISYISENNPGFYKTRRVHIKKQFPEILQEIEQFILINSLLPINFNDTVRYYVCDTILQNKCLCGKTIHHDSIYCSNKCKKDNISVVLSKSRATLKERYGEDSPLKISQFKKKFEDTCVDRFGETHPAKNKQVAQKIKDTNIETYKDPNLRKNVGYRIKKAYENDTAGIIEKRKQTNFIKTGEYKTLTSVAIKKAKSTLVEKYDTDNPFAIHENTYELAKLGCLKFFNNNENKEKSIQKRIETIIKKYGSLDKMNEIVFNNKRKKTINNLKDFGVIDNITQCKYNNLGFVTCRCHRCDKEYDISLPLLRDRTSRKDITCVLCSPTVQWRSNAEIELFNWLSTYIPCENNNKKILKGSEIDIFIPEKRIAIEFNGIYWHSDLFKDKNYHLNKTLFLKILNIPLIHIWEDLWNTKKDIIKGRILSKLGINQISIGARKCKIQEISSTTANKFYKINHLQGVTKGFKYVALYFNDEIISCISIGKRKLGKNKSINTFEILRFCNKIGFNCIGAFSKLFNYIIKNYPAKYISYADLCWGEGNVYKFSGFKLKEYSKPNYWYFRENQRYHRYTFNKQKLIKMGYDKNKTEFQIMNEDVKAFRVYDCGNAVWEYIK